MNHCYRLVFNRSTQVWQVVSEIAKSHSKSAAVVLLPLCSLFDQSYALAEPPNNALPTGGQVVSGQSTITQNGNQLNIVQGSQKSIINWQNYNIGSNAEVNYIQNNANSISLNRVVTNDPSAIFGKLNANGQVWLINPNGVLFGKGAQVNVGGLLATTLNMADDDFNNGKYQFTGSTGSVVNVGAITTSQGGYVAMLAPEVRNEGVISAMQGTVALAAGNAMTLDFNGSGLINVQVDSANVNTLIENKHLIQVGNGQVLMSAKAADGLITSVINNSGKIEANSMVNDGGVIRLTGAKTVINSGDISAISSSQKGGTVHLLGDNVGMFDSGSINVSGKTGGGTILVGGDFQGKNINIQNASKTFVHQDAQLIADATESGDGGKVIVWADDIARYYGSASAKGGSVSGNGGFVEISGKRLLNFLGSVDLSAANGVGGHLLLDPLNITLSDGVDANTDGFDAGLDNTQAFTDDAGLNSVFNVNAGGSFSGITAGSTITLQATNDITIANAFNVATATGSANNSLTLEANNNIDINAALTLDGTGVLTLKADADNNGAGDLAINAAIATDIGGANLYGANVTSSSAGTINTTGTANTSSGNIDIAASNSILLAANLITTGASTAGNNGQNAGNISLMAGGSISAIGTASFVAEGGAGAGSGDQNGGSGGLVSVIANSGIDIFSIQARGGDSVGTNGNSGNAGNITIRNKDEAIGATGNIAIRGNLALRAGIVAANGAGGLAGNIIIENQANDGNVSTSLIAADGRLNSNGSNVSITSQAGVTITGNINTSAGLTSAGNNGRNAGNISIVGENRSITGTITANGGAANGTDLAGGAAGMVSITGAGTLSAAAINVRSGASTGAGASGLVGSVNLTGSNITTNDINTSAQANGNGGNINITGSGSITTGAITTSSIASTGVRVGGNAGSVTISGATGNIGAIVANGGSGSGANQAGGNAGSVMVSATLGSVQVTNITATGGNGASTNGNGGNGGIVTLDAAAGSNILIQNISTTGGNGAGSGVGGSGGTITLEDNVLLTSDSTLTSTGGSAGVGIGGAINFNGTVNSNGVARSLTIDSNGATTFTGAVGDIAALSTLNTDAAGATSISGGSITTIGAQTYNDAVNLGANTTFTTTNSNIDFANSINANNNNVVVVAGTGVLTAINAANDFGNLAITAASADVRDANAIILGASNLTGAYTLQTAGNITQNSAVAVGGATTLNAGASGDITLNNANNNFNSAAITSAQNVNLVDSNALTVDASTVGSITARTLSDNLTLGGNIAASNSGDAVVLASAANFINTGNSTLSTPAGRWLVYANSHIGNTFGGLASGNQAIYGRSFPTAITETGNRYVFANSPTLTFTSTDITKDYGVNAATSVASAFEVTGFIDAASFGNVFTQDTLANTTSGSPSVTSTGSATTASVAGSPYTITVDVTPVTFTNGYTGAAESVGELTINRIGLTITANNQTKTYGDNFIFAGTEFTSTGLVNGETIGSVALSSTGAASSADVNGSPYDITINNAAAGTFDANNYSISYVDGSLEVERAALTITANNTSKLVGTANPAFSSTITGFVNSETSNVLVGSLDYTTDADDTSPVGTYTITPFGVTADNYVISFVDGTLNVAEFIENTGSDISGADISVFNNATTRPEQAIQTCQSQGAGQSMINGLDAFGVDDVDYETSISQPQVGGVVANALAGTSCSKL